jgi:hypothetical protein
MKRKINYGLSITLMTVLVTFQTQVNSEAVCKGMIETDCTANPSCTWVNSYVTRKGTEVSGYCRVISRSKSLSSKADSKGDV